MDLGDYLGRVTPYYNTLPRYMNMLAALIQPLVDAQAMLYQLRRDFDIDTAVGVQLDQVGQWVGRTRYITTPISGVFFAFNGATNDRTGFDQGQWLGQYQPTDAIIALDDETYRTILKLQVQANQWDGTLESISASLSYVFPNLFIQDLGDTPAGLMAMHVLIPTSLVSSLLLYVAEQDFPIKPSGVRMTFIDNPLGTGQPVFSFDVPYATEGPLGGWEGGLPPEEHSVWGAIIFTA
jgi:hypothetical protein